MATSKGHLPLFNSGQGVTSRLTSATTNRKCMAGQALFHSWAAMSQCLLRVPLGGGL
jgi:hypothetical protein